MDRSISVKTPESIAFAYELAGLGSRFLAMWIDLLIQIAITAAIFTGLGLLATRTAMRTSVSVTPQWAQSLGIAILAFIIFAIFFGYFVLFEALRAGRTPGKQIIGIRVVRDGGYPVDFASSLIRNLVRVAEFSFGFYAISAVATLLSPENKRMGDMAAGTIVVRDSRVATLAMLQEDTGAQARVLMLTPEEHELIDRFVARRAGLAPGPRGLLAARIADSVRSRLSSDLRRLDDEELLERLSAS